MTTLIPIPGQAFESVAKYVPGSDVFQTETRLPTQTVAPGETVEVDIRGKLVPVRVVSFPFVRDGKPCDGI